MKKVTTILLLFLCFCSTAFAQNLQEFSVVSFEEKPFDTAARDENYKIVDGNGELFSIIKLVPATPDDDLRAYSFDFGLCESRVKIVDGDVWVYVQRNAMRATIKRDGFKTVKYELPVTVQPGQVFEMTLQATPRVAKKRILLLEVSPADSKAQVTYKAEGEKEYRLFGDGVIDEGGMLSMRLELGTYYYRIISKNYHLSEGRIELDDAPQKYTEKVTLRPNYGTLTLKAAAGADIYIDGEKVGTGQWSGILSPGNYNVECQLRAHKNSIKTVKVNEGDKLTVQLDAPTPITGTLSLQSSPLGATVAIDGKECGTTPEDFAGLLIGAHKVTVSKSGYKTVTVDVDVKENEVVEQNVVLEKVVSDTPNQTIKSKKSQDSTVNGQANNFTITASGIIDGHEYVDLGLPSGIKWATCNVGATKPEEYGGYYAWGETEEKDNYYWSTYKWCNDSENTMTKYCIKRKNGTVDKKTVLDPEDDVAHVKWGASWRMPTRAELDELRNNCIWTWTTQNGVDGYKVTGPNGNSIFLPAAGYRLGTRLDNSGSVGYYWSSSLYESISYYAYNLFFYSGRYDWSNYYRSDGLSVRPVSK